MGQRGEQGVRALLAALFQSNPDADLIIVDVDHGWGERARMQRPLATSYYNSHFLLHSFTMRFTPSRCGGWSRSHIGRRCLSRVA